jgi:hypothetical protein
MELLFDIKHSCPARLPASKNADTLPNNTTTDLPVVKSEGV